VGAHRAENPGTNGWLILLWSAVAVLVLVVVGIFATLVGMGRIDLFPQPASTAAPVPEDVGVIDTSYSVMVLNATPDETLDDGVRENLIDEGWAADTVFAVDGSTDDFPQTTVFYVADADEEAALGLADLLGGAAVEQSDTYAELNDTDGAQLTVVLGLDRAAAAPESDDAPSS